ncbi:MAG: hypothetical protein GWN58_04905, partial [Anaerolineae bacterium]|nr:hypothetical protein [Anaerolineae bacterium]
MPRQDRLLSRASELAGAGKREDACLLLRAVIREDPHNERAWFQYVRTLLTVEEQIEALKEFLRYDPGNKRAQAVLWTLWEKKLGEEQAGQAAQREAVRKYRVLGFAWLALFLVTLGALLVGALWLRQSILEGWANRYEALSAEHERLQQDHGALREVHATLIAQQKGLEQSYQR